MSHLGSAIMCGGQSRRMGQPKALLQFGAETMIERTVRTLASCSAPIVVVAAPGQQLPDLPNATIARDPVEALVRGPQGPLQGIAVGLCALESKVSWAFVSSTDAPFLTAGYVMALAELCDDATDIVVVRSGGYHHPLAALYRTALHAHASKLLAADVRRPRALFDAVRTRVVDPDELLRGTSMREPDLASLRNMNTPEDYRAALRELGVAAG